MRTARHFLLVAALACLTVPAPHAGPQLGSRTGEEWIKMLDSPSRTEGLKIPEILERLRLKPGDVVADIGAGTGVFSLPLAKAVAPAGTVFAVEVDQQLVDHIGRKAADQKVSNLRPTLGKFGDPGLPAASVDFAFIHDVLHHIQDRAGYLKALSKSLKPAGRIALIEFHPDRGGHRNQAEMHVTKDQAAAWMADAGLKPVEEFDLFAEKYFVIYARR
jgi:ubiquinone/menaquinone biosynthesis C-methylase UbiE